MADLGKIDASNVNELAQWAKADKEREEMKKKMSARWKPKENISPDAIRYDKPKQKVQASIPSNELRKRAQEGK